MLERVRRRSLADLLLVVVALGGAGTCCQADQQNYLDEAKKFHLAWAANVTHVTFVASVETTGWIGVGFSPSGGMAGADMVVGWVTSAGEHVLQDRHSEKQGPPELDSSQDYHLIWANETGERTTIAFARKISTCDPNDYEITGDTTRVIYAYGDKDPDGHTPTYHDSRRGVRSLAILGHQTLAVTEKSTEVDVVPSTNITLPNDTTTYWCSLIKFHDFQKKNQMIKWKPIVTPGNEGVVHHMLLFGCYDNKDRSTHQGSNASFKCSGTQNMPSAVSECSQLIAVWAIGGEATLFPRDVGFPFDENNQPGYVLLQTHYDNPLRRNGIVDRSGFRIALTTELRQYDAGVLQTGHSVVGMEVPPRQDNFRVHGFCADACASALPSGGVDVFAVMLHAHLLGRKIHVRHYRNGSELKLLASDNHYDFNYQDFRPIVPAVRVLPPRLRIRPATSRLSFCPPRQMSAVSPTNAPVTRARCEGDTLQVTCSLDSRNRPSVTVGGIATQDEMCLAYLLYYPKMNMTMCQSAPADLLSRYMKARGILGESFPKHPAEGVNWNDSANGDIAQDLYDTAPVLTECVKDYATAMSGHLSIWTPPAETGKELKPQPPACLQLPAGGTAFMGTAGTHIARLWLTALAWLAHSALSMFRLPC